MMDAAGRFQSIRIPATPDGLTLTLPLEDGARYLINPGSVGQPRDHDWRAGFAILDTDRKEVEYYRTPYHVAQTQSQNGKGRTSAAPVPPAGIGTVGTKAGQAIGSFRDYDNRMYRVLNDSMTRLRDSTRCWSELHVDSFGRRRGLVPIHRHVIKGHAKGLGFARLQRRGAIRQGMGSLLAAPLG